MSPPPSIEPDVRLDAGERPKVAVPLMPEFAMISTFVLTAAPIVLVGATAIAALVRRRRPPTGGGLDDPPEARLGSLHDRLGAGRGPAAR